DAYPQEEPRLHQIRQWLGARRYDGVELSECGRGSSASRERDLCRSLASSHLATTSPLIPAKAGTQTHKGRRRSAWFPAFAGMSGREVGSDLFPQRSHKREKAEGAGLLAS